MSEQEHSGSVSNNPSEGTQENNLQAELEKAKGEHLYLRAEFDNYRKQALKERSELLKYGCERLVVELLSVLDNFDRARKVNVNSENIESFKQGMDMVASELKQVLSRFGVNEMDSAGKPFDPAHHEAIGTELQENEPQGKIMHVLRTAYKLHDKLIRPAQVVIATKPNDSKEERE